MTPEQRWVEETTAQYYSDQLARRRPDSLQEGTPLATVTNRLGAHAVLQVVDAMGGFKTPEIPFEILGLFVLYKALQGLAEASRVQWIEE